MTTARQLTPALSQDIDGFVAFLSREKPPYIFGSYFPAKVGDRGWFTTSAGVRVMFQVTRLTNAREWRERWPYSPLPNPPPTCYYEAEVRD